MTLQFHRAIELMEIWSAGNDCFSFVISYESPSGPGFHGRAGYLASWRPLDLSRGAIKIAGSPFKTFAEAEKACNTMLQHLARGTDVGRTPEGDQSVCGHLYR
jgi:hypothetical protein